MNARHLASAALRPLLTIALMAPVTAALSACSSVPGGDPSPRSEELGRVASPVIKGKNSDKSQDAVVLLIHFDPSKGAFGSCTGTMLSDRLVLTARHCVADTDESAACDAQGNPLALGEIRGNHKPSTMYVFVGPNRPDFGSRDIRPDGQGVQILDDGGKNLCNHDIALVVLKEPIPNAKIAPIRLDDPVKLGETITSIGWGVTDTTAEPAVRQQRTGVKVESVGPADAGFPVPPNEFGVGESICSGDSGGPAIASTKAVIGVVSRGGNARRPDPQRPASSCLGGSNLYTKVSPFKKFILGGFTLVEADPWLENGPDPRLLKPGSVCSDGAECRSNLCLLDPAGATTCAEDCSVNACPEGQTCSVEGDAQVCRAPAAPAPATPAAPVTSAKSTTTSTLGCSSAPGGSGSTGALGLLLAAAALVSVRRKR
jgi:MYXO-CTERM domain-containing protein